MSLIKEITTFEKAKNYAIGGALVVTNIGKMLASEARDTGNQELDAYRRYMHDSRHYRTELNMFTQVSIFFMKDLAKLQPQVILENLQNRTTRIGIAELLRIQQDYLLAWYAYDDLIDNSPLRGTLPSYHLIQGNERVRRIYESSRGSFLKLMNIYHPNDLSRFSTMLDDYERAAEDESQNHYFKIDLKNYHKPSNMFNILARKASSLTAFSLEPAEKIIGANAPEEWHEALRNGCEATWLISDCLKDATEPGPGRWIELKSGRLSLPTVLALDLLGDGDKKRYIEVIEEIWNIYQPVFQNMKENVLGKISELDRMPKSQMLFGQFRSGLQQSGAIDILRDQVRNRINYSHWVSRQYGGLNFLNFFLTGSAVYSMKKKSLLGLCL